jgi:hypothetical protein
VVSQRHESKRSGGTERRRRKHERRVLKIAVKERYVGIREGRAI